MRETRMKLMNQRDKSIIQDYETGMTLNYIMEKYGFKTQTPIFKLLEKHDIPKRNKRWTEEQIEFLKLNYGTLNWNELEVALFPFTKNSIIKKASSLNIRRENYYFSDEEIKLLSENYNKMTTKQLINTYFSNRTESSIMTKANKLGLVSRESWCEEENNKLINLYPNFLNSELAEIHFPNRTVSAIQSQADKLGLKKHQCRREYTKDFLLDELIKFSKEIMRTPSGEDIRGNENMPSYTTYHRYFNGYSNACIEAGLEVNTGNIFGKDAYYISSNGDVCFSNAELIITEMLIKHKLKYEKETLYKDIVDDGRCGFKRCDWLLENNVIIEYFGMPEKEIYKKKMETKFEICKDNNLILIPIYRKDLNKLEKIILKLSQTISVTTERVPPCL